jgi:uncharacterized protein (TIGR02145 family)
MTFFTRGGCKRTLFLAALAAGAVLTVGCGDGAETAAGPETPAVTKPGVVPDTPADTDTFTDARDGQKYRKVTIGTQTWMAQNLNFKTDSSWCYDNADSNCAKYGRLYNWEAAAEACPNGWKLPDTAEWNALVIEVGGDEIAGQALKAKNMWIKSKSPAVYETDRYAFSALPGGIYEDYAEHFVERDYSGFWWTSVGVAETNNLIVHCRSMTYDKNHVWAGYTEKTNRLSLRCVNVN